MRRLHQKFVDEYVKTYLFGKPNGTQAAINAGYKASTAGVQASRLLSRDDINEAIDAKLAEKEPKSEVSRDALVSGLKEIAFSKTAADRDRLRAIELLGKTQNLFTDKIGTDTPASKEIPEEKYRKLCAIAAEYQARERGIVNSQQAAEQIARQQQTETLDGHGGPPASL